MSLTDTQFDQVAETAYRLWGLHLTEKKRTLVTARIQKHVARSRFDTPGEYLKFIETDATDQDRLEFFDLLSTNVTSFFREPRAFDFLERELWTPLSRGTSTRPDRTVRIWSAACSTGPEPYTIGIHAHEHLTPFDKWKVNILASDLASSALATARRGVYPMKMVESIDRPILKKYFQKGTGKASGYARIDKSIKSMVTFEQRNLMDPWPKREPFDVIFCRNCMIYFDRETRNRLVNRFYDALSAGGWLIIGSSETLSGCDTKFTTAQPSVYVK